MRLNLIIDTKYKDSIIYKKGNKTYTVDSQKFLKKLYTVGMRDFNENEIILPPNCLSVINGTNFMKYKIVIESFSDYITLRKRDWEIKQTKKYFIKWPKMIATVELNEKGNVIKLILKRYSKNEKLVKGIKGPNFYGDGTSCIGSYDPKVNNIIELENEIKKILQVPFNNDFFVGDPDKFFKSWEKIGYDKTIKKFYEKEKGGV